MSFAGDCKRPWIFLMYFAYDLAVKHEEQHDDLTIKGCEKSGASESRD